MPFIKSLLFPLSLLFVACSSNDKFLVVERDEFKEMLKEIHIIDAAVGVNNGYDGKVYPSEEDYMYILEKRGLDKESFYFNVIYYQQQKELGGIYDQVLQELNVEKVKYEKMLEAEGEKMKPIDDERKKDRENELQRVKEKKKKEAERRKNKQAPK